MIDLKEYQHFASQGILPATKEREPIVAFALGLVGETGEVVDDIKKKIYHGRNIPIEHTEEELGDVMWYVANIANTLGLDLETIIQKNVSKLKERYAEQYNEDVALPKDGVILNIPEYGKVKCIQNGPHIAMHEYNYKLSTFSVRGLGKFIKFISKKEYNQYVRECEQRNKDSEPDLPWE